MSDWKPENDLDSIFPTVADIKSAALYDSNHHVQINWAEVDRQGANFDDARKLAKRLPALELLYNTWREKAMENDRAALELSQWILHELVDEMYNAYQLQDIADKYDAVKALDKLI